MWLTTYSFVAFVLCVTPAIAQVVVSGKDQDANPGAVHVDEATQAPLTMDGKVFDIPFGSYGEGPNFDETTSDYNDETKTDHKPQVAQPGMVRNVIRKKKLKWPKAVVPYEIDSNKYRKSDLSMIKAAIEEFHKHTCIRFVKRHPNIKNYVKITAKGSGTYVGRRKLYEHKVTLETPSCMKKGTIMHELMHSLGIYHEHMRPDRDKFIQINWGNIAKDNHNNFITLKNEEAQVFNLTYDYSSLMHYSPYAFAVNKTIPTMIPISVPNVRSSQSVKIGQRVKFSDKDIKKLNYLYECHKNKKWKRKNQ